MLGWLSFKMSFSVIISNIAQKYFSDRTTEVGGEIETKLVQDPMTKKYKENDPFSLSGSGFIY